MAFYTVPLIINGEEYAPQGAFEVRSPVTDEVLHLCSLATETDATAAVEAAAAAFPSWKSTDPATRRDICLKAADLMCQRREELEKLLIGELGIGGQYATFNVDTTINMLRDVAGRVSTLAGSVPHVADPNTSAMIWQEPYGVVLAIAPWNASFILGTRAVLYPIAAGCTVVHKGSEWAPRCMHRTASILHEAGLPRGVLNFITTDRANAAPVTESIIANDHVKKLNFTGSGAVGQIIAKIAGQYLKPLVLELGGKSPAIIWDDANLDLAAVKCAVGAFMVAGQVCMSTERIIVHKSVSEKFLPKLRHSIAQIWPDAFSLINTQATKRNARLVSDAISKGASVLHGDINPQEIINAEDPTKTKMPPIMLGNVTSTMDIYHQESFGPVVSYIEVGSKEEAVRVANDTQYGLTAAVFTEDLRTGLWFARNIESGAVHINDMTAHDEPALPHGGVKGSGYGRFGSSCGLEEYLKTKTVTWKN